MRRLFVPRAQLGADRVPLGPADLHYVRDVLRLGPGDAIEVFDGEGGAHDGRIAPGGDAVLLGARRASARPATPLQLVFALARGDRCDVVAQKATELGVTRLTPFEAARSVVRLGRERAEERVRRWTRIAAEAARQCGRADVPTVDGPAPLARALAAADPAHRVVVAYEGGGAPLADALAPGAPGHVVVIGPEGGFAPEEIEGCRARGATLVTLGPRILRFETAAIVAVALVQYVVGDLGSDRSGPGGPDRAP